MTPAAAPRYPIRVVARMTGLSVDTLRAWERRYQVVTPLRDDRGRSYSDAHVSRLKQLAQLVEQGHAIGAIAGLSDAALRNLQQSPAAESSSRHDAAQIDLGPLLLAIKHYDLPGVEAILNRYAVMLAPEALVFSVVLPVLRDIGERWEAGTIRAAHEHLLSAVMRSVLGGLLRTLARSGSKTPLVFATLSGERHELGLLCGAVLAAAAGHSVLYLGPDLPAADISHAVKASKASTLILAGTAPLAAGIDDLKAIKRLADDVTIWVGGAQAEGLRSALGPRVSQISNLDELRSRLTHAA